MKSVYFVQVRSAPDRIWLRDRGCIYIPKSSMAKHCSSAVF